MEDRRNERDYVILVLIMWITLMIWGVLTAVTATIRAEELTVETTAAETDSHGPSDLGMTGTEATAETEALRVVEAWVWYDGPMIQETETVQEILCCAQDDTIMADVGVGHYGEEDVAPAPEEQEGAEKDGGMDCGQVARATATRSASRDCVEFSDEDVRMLAVLLENESIDLPGKEAVYPLWCVLNRLDDTSGDFPGTIYGILTQPRQFLSSYDRTPRQVTMEVVKHELLSYLGWRLGENDRPMPEGLTFYCSGPHHQYNIFRTSYYGGHHWARGEWID